jgi:hypothetical protein
MSIRTEIKARQLDGRLKRFTSLLPVAVEPREIYLAREVSDAFGEVGITNYEAWLFGLAQARFEQFINGDEFVCRIPPSRKSPRKTELPLAMLEPVEDQVWEFRIGKLRIFGRFADKDVFVATNWGLRQILDTDRQKWRFAIQSCRSEWTRLFPAFNPLVGDDLHDYLTNARTIV